MRSVTHGEKKETDRDYEVKWRERTQRGERKAGFAKGEREVDIQRIQREQGV